MHADGETFTMAPLLMTRRSLSTQHQALPVHVRARVGSQGDLGLDGEVWWRQSVTAHPLWSLGKRLCTNG